LLVAGAGMAGLVCAARARELGLVPRLIEKGTRAGGSMLLSSGVVWRHVEWETFRAECPGGDPALQRLVWERLDSALEWLVPLGAEPVWEDTENPLTTGKRFDPRALTALLAQLTYWATSFARLGCDFRTPLLPLFNATCTITAFIGHNPVQVGFKWGIHHPCHF